MTTCMQPEEWPGHVRISKVPLAFCQFSRRLAPRYPDVHPCTPHAGNTESMFPHAPFAWEWCRPGSDHWNRYLLGDYRGACS